MSDVKERPIRKEGSQSLPHHVSGALHVTGKSRFIGDEPAPPGMLIAKVLVSPHAHARIAYLDTAAARILTGVAAVLTFRDIPGENQIGAVIKDQPLFPVDEVTYVGQPVAVVLAENARIARKALALIRVEYEPLEAVLTVAEALTKGLFFAPERLIERGDPETSMIRSENVLEGTIRTGAQEHVYLETHRTRAIPGEDGDVTLYCSTQAPGEVQEIVSHVLGTSRKDVTVDVKRLGGGFGGKEAAATLWAALAALGAHCTGRPVDLTLTRHEDLAWSGKRHPFECRYQVGFSNEGRITAYIVELNANGGAYADLSMSILERAMLHADNAYYLPHVRIVGHGCRTNLPPNTAFRGFGAPQGIFVLENVLQRIAHHLHKDPVEVRALNAYRDGQETPFGQPVFEACTPELIDRLVEKAGYYERRRAVAAFNKSHLHKKRGLGMVPVKFGISFTASHLNQASALVLVYTDGSVSVSHGAVEMGQEVNTKMAQVAADTLGVTLDKVRVESNNTKRIGNGSPTAASTGADLNGHATRLACEQIIARLRDLAAELLHKKTNLPADPRLVRFDQNRIFDGRARDISIPFSELTHQAHFRRIDLSAHAFYATPGVHFDRVRGKGRPFAYFVFGAALVEVEIDLLTGGFKPLMVHIVHETAQSINSAVDLGQIEGAFFQGMGWCTMEELTWDDKGRYLATSLSTYKIPTIRDLPLEWTVEMVERKREHASVKGSKAIGEPPLIYGEAVWFAIKNAVESLDEHRTEAALEMPATPEAILKVVDALQASVGTRKGKKS